MTTMPTKETNSVCAQLEPLLTMSDLERMLRVDKRTIARLIKRGQLPRPLKLGGSNRWKTADIAAALDVLGHRHDSTGKAAEELVLVR